MPRFTIIVPAHGVQGRLPDCLDSVLDQTYGDFELAVVGAPGSLPVSIADTYAARDSRVRVVHSGAQAGLAAARNAGLTAATGQFVLFLEGDDTLVPGALGAVDARLAALGDPDLLVFDHERVHWFDGTQGAGLARLWAGAPQGAFRLEDHPLLADPLVPAWSAAYRRGMLTRHQLLFSQGTYTDWAWSVLAALHADRIGLLEQICVRHLLRRQDERLHRPGSHHMEQLDQFNAVMTRAAELEPAPAVLGALFHRCVHGILKAATSPWRGVPLSLHRRFFRRATRLYRQHRPAGYLTPGGSVGVQHRLLAAGAYSVFRALSTVRRLRRNKRRPVRRMFVALRWARRKLSPGTRWYRSCLKQPVDENLAVFASYWGRGYACNPAAIHAAATRLAPSLRSVFLVTEENVSQMPDGVECVVIGTPEYWEVMARAKYTFNNVNFEQTVRKRPGTVHVQTQHGTPLKRMGLDTSQYPAATSTVGNFQHLLQRVSRWDFSLSSNRHSTEIWERVYPGGYENIEYGYPRNDAFYTATAEDVRAVRRRLGVPEDRIALLYAPTFRDYRSTFDAQLELASFCEALGDEFVVLLRAHHSYEGSAGQQEAVRSGRLIDLTEHRSPEEVCLASDAMITDYSSIMFDYANLDRPLVIFAPDWDVYSDTRGVYFDLRAAPPGPVAADQGRLTEVFRSGEWAGAESRRLRAAFRERFCEFDDGRAAERVVRRVILGEPSEALPPVVPLQQRVPAPSVGPKRIPSAGGNRREAGYGLSTR
ncbi:bifunctional glycosyltransferase/CDP-glycerol:glycerophosphate glycerophosphotransferase [Streptomyces cavernicola]|uniref:Bifunctional glycosyltransferase family 2 protein/CDP-glycerol:glycerophosphate glycerophosphotransferase n=1 Tax=Streptomyces cavernicola TaxID=3043613 RepID=A0ABT6SAS1_9ACTN|nr:bifunctional glycosyltransferase family 2 protein/CDP-glycerol:glycerophosphate glycerophosphotransferase [Streptomyces sp. B-S-A6]MDI3404411.1 bifunctional glycosyltransferase family 2 protein/CDP-glycerol:glycerophosphate glycerophosphotransferase [Streptomyces sp. B-S-A6]